MHSSGERFVRICLLWPLMLAALFVAGLAGRLYGEASEFIDGAQPLSGTVPSQSGSLVGSGRYSSISYTIHVSFVTPDGQPSSDGIDVPWPLQGGRQRDLVAVLWNPSKTDALRLDSLWGV